MTYDTAFYDRIRAGAQLSADVVVPLACELVDPKRVVDVGCGEGVWGKRFEDLGCEVVGYDGAYVDERAIAFVECDLEQPLETPEEPFDLAVCLEVAEHLPAGRGESFIRELCALAPAVLFSAAIPGQSGNHHVNCRWPSYWERLFDAGGYLVSDALRWRIWDDARVEPWYRQNLLIAWDRERPLAAAAAGQVWLRPGVVDVVHPEIWGWKL